VANVTLARNENGMAATALLLGFSPAAAVVAADVSPLKLLSFACLTPLVLENQE